MLDPSKEYKDGHSLVWDEEGKFREQQWPELRERIEKTQGGIGVVADDFWKCCDIVLRHFVIKRRLCEKHSQI